MKHIDIAEDKDNLRYFESLGTIEPDPQEVIEATAIAERVMRKPDNFKWRWQLNCFHTRARSSNQRLPYSVTVHPERELHVIRTCSETIALIKTGADVGSLYDRIQSSLLEQ